MCRGRKDNSHAGGIFPRGSGATPQPRMTDTAKGGSTSLSLDLAHHGPSLRLLLLPQPTWSRPHHPQVPTPGFPAPCPQPAHSRPTAPGPLPLSREFLSLVPSHSTFRSHLLLEACSEAPAEPSRPLLSPAITCSLVYPHGPLGHGRHVRPLDTPSAQEASGEREGEGVDPRGKPPAPPHAF